MTANEVIECLKVRFGGEAFAFLEQVADGTGARKHRWADAVAMSVWPSRGFDIHGIEVKVSRYDFLNELKNPEKSAAVQQYCNRWWIATPDTAIVMERGEIPPTWGWMVTNGKGGMKVIVEAPPLKPKAISIEFLASLLRNVQKADEAGISRRIDKARGEARDEGGRYYKQKYDDLQKTVKEFRAASGIDLSHAWNGGQVGESLRVLSQLRYRTEHISSAIKACDDIRSMLDKVQSLAQLQALDRPNGTISSDGD